MMEKSQWGLKTFIGIILGAGVFLAVSFLFLAGSKNETLIKCIYIAMVAVFYGLTGAIGYSIFARYHLQQFSLITLSINVLGFLMTSVAIFSETKSTTFIKVVIAFAILAIALAQITMLYKIEIINRYAAVCRIVAVAMISLFTLLLLVMIFQYFNDSFVNMVSGQQFNGTEGKAFGALLSLDIAFTAITPLVNKLINGRIVVENPVEELLSHIQQPETNI